MNNPPMIISVEIPTAEIGGLIKLHPVKPGAVWNGLELPSGSLLRLTTCAKEGASGPSCLAVEDWSQAGQGKNRKWLWSDDIVSFSQHVPVCPVPCGLEARRGLAC